METLGVNKDKFDLILLTLIQFKKYIFYCILYYNVFIEFTS